MTKRVQAKYKIERRYGLAISGRAKSPVHKRSYHPGQHGPKGPRKLTERGQQLRSKQILKGYYGDITESQFHRTFKEAARRRGDTVENFVGLLESRLSTIVYRLKWAPTMYSARQLVNHKHVTVNGRTVNISSYRARQGDVIGLKDGMRQNIVVQQSIASTERSIPEYLDHKAHEWSGTYVYVPELAKIPYPVQMNVGAIVEFYSR